MGPDNLFRLSKYYLQILAGVTNQNIVRDPEGYLTPGATHRIPFILNETDITTDIILLSAAPPVLFNFVVETPKGDIIDMNAAAAMSNVDFVKGNNVSYYRITLPVVVGGKGSGPGEWNAILSLNSNKYKGHLTELKGNATEHKLIQTHGVRYSLSVHSLSNLRMHARVLQSDYEPGAMLTIRTTITEYGLPLKHRALVYAEIERPDTTHTTLALNEIEPGIYEVQTIATLPGIYHMKILASGITMRGKPFTREQLLTGAVWKGGNNPPPVGATDPRIRDEQLYNLFNCLFGTNLFNKFFEENRINQKVLQDCLRKFFEARTERDPEGPPMHKLTGDHDEKNQ
jgi:hypothetical protein